MENDKMQVIKINFKKQWSKNRFFAALLEEAFWQVIIDYYNYIANNPEFYTFEA